MLQRRQLLILTERQILPPLPDDELAYKEYRRFWPTSKIDAIVDISGEECGQDLVPSIADKLAASSFYLELAKDPQFYTSSPTVVEIMLKCRLPPGPALADFMVKFRSKSSRFHSSDSTSSLICPKSVWERIKGGGQFLQRLQAEIVSPELVIDVHIDNLYGTGRMSISNCPCDLRLLERFSNKAGNINLL